MLNFHVSFLGGIQGYKRLSPEFSAVEPDVTRHAPGCKEQRSKRDEKANH